ncbi:hypothetical protein EC988_002221 [Linderina pennispora]|nr:hypothetical protein EC988_002221 [Linderina pennispora]
MEGPATPVVDLTNSPPERPNAAENVVLLSSDDETAPLPSTTAQHGRNGRPLGHLGSSQQRHPETHRSFASWVAPQNMVSRLYQSSAPTHTARAGMRRPPQVLVGHNRLPPIQSRQEGENHDFQRVNSLRHVLRIDSARRRPRLWTEAQRNSGPEGETGIRPIRAQPLPRQSRTWSRAPERYRPRAATVGEETEDGAIDVEAVDDSMFEESTGRYAEQARQARGDMTDEEEAYEDQARRYMTRAMAARFASENLPIFPFHPGLQIHHFAGNHDIGPSPFDFFDGDDMADIISFIEANAPPAQPSSRRGREMQPLKLNSLQLDLAKLPEYTRAVPEPNFRDADMGLVTCDSSQIVCVECKDALYAQDPIWAPSCGHVLCNSCYDAFKGQYKKCAACGKRTAKKNLVHLFP